MNKLKDFSTPKVIVKKKGVFLRVPLHIQLSLDEIKKMLLKRGVLVYEEQEIKKILLDPSGSWQKIAEYTKSDDPKTSLIVEILEDGMSAQVKMSAPLNGERTLSFTEVVDILSQHGIVSGILFDNISTMVNEELCEVFVVVAKGIDPIPEQKEGFEYLFLKPHENSLTFHNLKDIESRIGKDIFSVKKGDILVKAQSFQKGKYGVNIFGKEVKFKDTPPIYFSCKPIKKGNNVILKNGNLVAGVSGYAFIHLEVLNISDVLVINGDLGKEIGDLYFDGKVKVKGNIAPELTVKAVQDIVIEGRVDGASLYSRGDICVNGGISKGFIKAQKGVATLFLKQSKVFAKQDVLVQEVIEDSHVETQGKVMTLTPQGKIMGGEIIAKEGVDAQIIGNETHAKTAIQVGVDPEMKRTLEYLAYEEENVKSSLEKIETIIQNNGQINSTQKENQVKQKALLEELYSFQGKLLNIMEKKQWASKALKKDNPHSYVAFSGRLYPGVSITVNESRFVSERVVVAHKLTSNGKELILEPFYKKESKPFELIVN
jgi:uncharacterized protein (DUF342 family)